MALYKVKTTFGMYSEYLAGKEYHFMPEQIESHKHLIEPVVIESKPELDAEVKPAGISKSPDKEFKKGKNKKR